MTDMLVEFQLTIYRTERRRSSSRVSWRRERESSRLTTDDREDLLRNGRVEMDPWEMEGSGSQHPSNRQKEMS